MPEATEVKERITWVTEKRRLEELKPADYNPRQANEKEVKDLTTSLERFNLADPIIINKNNNVIGGHFRLKILKDRGLSEVDVRVPSRELTQEEEVELNIRLNKNLGSWDFGALANFDEALLKDIGFDSKELDKIFQLDMAPDADDVPQARPENEVGVMLGDLYQLGPHRLLCGDSTQREAVERLMAGNKADMVFTDPPYGVDYDGGVGCERDTWGDKREHYQILIKSTFEMANIFSKDKAALLLFHSSNRTKDVFDAMGEYVLRDTLIWNKTNAHYGALWAQYKIRYEPLIYAYKKGQAPFWYGDTKQRNVIDIEQPTKNKEHPTMKPIDLLCVFIPNHTKREDMVFDPFGGSGSTLIACERLNRKCYMMEIDRVYAEVICERWEKYTGGKRVKL